MKKEREINQQGVWLNPQNPAHQLLTVGFGWKVSGQKLQLEQIFGQSKPNDFDIDALALLLDSEGRIRSFGVDRDLGGGKRTGLIDSDLIFFNNLMHPTQAVWHGGDELPGGTSRDVEQIFIKLDAVPEAYGHLLFFLCIHHAGARQQHFGSVRQIYVRIFDAFGKEISVLSAPNSFGQGKSVLLLAEIVREGEGWEFRPAMRELESESFVEMLREYL